MAADTREMNGKIPTWTLEEIVRKRKMREVEREQGRIHDSISRVGGGRGNIAS